MLLFLLFPGGQFVAKRVCANPQRRARGKSFHIGEMQKIYRKGFFHILRGIFSFCAGKVA